jgi:cell division protein FtsL
MSALVEKRARTHSAQPGQASTRRNTGGRPYIAINGATMVSIAAIALTIIGLLYLIQTSQVAELGYDMSRLQTQRDSLSLEISELQYEMARYESLQTVERVAEERLGMTPMTNYEFIAVQEPAQRELTLPEPEQFASKSLTERVFHALAGIGSAGSTSTQAQGQPADEVTR